MDRPRGLQYENAEDGNEASGCVPDTRELGRSAREACELCRPPERVRVTSRSRIDRQGLVSPSVSTSDHDVRVALAKERGESIRRLSSSQRLGERGNDGIMPGDIAEHAQVGCFARGYGGGNALQLVRLERSYRA